MHIGRAIKISAFMLAGFATLAIAGGTYFIVQFKTGLEQELAQRLPAITKSLGIVIHYEDVAFSLFTGPALEGVSVTSENQDPLLRVKSIRLLYSLHLRPEFHVLVEGLRLVRPKAELVINEEGVTKLPDQLGGLIGKGKGSVPSSAPVADVPVQLSPQLQLLWRQGQVHIADKRAAATDPSPSISLQEIAGDLIYDRQDATISLETKARVAEEGGQLEFKATRSEGDVKMEVATEELALATFKSFLPPFVVVSADTKAKLQLNVESKGLVWDTDFSVELHDVALNHWRLADRRINDIDAGLAGKLQFDPAAKRLQWEHLNFDTNGLVLTANGQAAFADGFKLDTVITSKRVPLQRALDALPRDFVPALSGAKVDGTIKIDMSFGLDTANLKTLKFEPDIEIENFRLLQASEAVDIEMLKQPFLHRARKAGEVVQEFWVGRRNRRFVPYARLGKDTIKGVMTCEDGSFFRHNGFRVDHFRESLIQDIRERRFARGASTITMQTAKNLFLTGKKNLSRKFQEILIAYAMEQMLSKQRILEIYMNIIEWGPKIYGIGAASRHYFSKWPKELNPLEAAFLGSIIATPLRGHHMYRRGHVSDHWATYLALIVSKMGIHGREYTELEPFEPEFDWIKKQRLAAEKQRQSEAATRKPKKSRRRLRGRRV